MDPSQYDIADAGTEEMWIDTDGTPYLYYTGPDNRYCSIIIIIILYSSVALKLDIILDSDNRSVHMQGIEGLFAL